MRIAVIGATGFVGRRVVDALAGAGVEPLVDRGIDLDDPATFTRLDGVDAVIDASAPGHGTPALARYCLERGLRLIDCTAHAPTTGELVELGSAGPGAVIIGAGLFPGVSNLLAAREPDARAILVELDPLSGAGGGTIDSLTGALAGPRLRAVRIGGRPALALESSDAVIAAALGPRPLELLITTRQRWLARFLPLSAWLGRRRILGRLIAGAANLGLKLLRGRLLRRRRCSIAIYTVGAEVRLAFAARDGFAALARAITWAAITAAREPQLRGVQSFADLVSADPSRPRRRRSRRSAPPASGCT